METDSRQCSVTNNINSCPLSDSVIKRRMSCHTQSIHGREATVMEESIAGYIDLLLATFQLVAPALSEERVQPSTLRCLVGDSGEV